MIKLLQKNCFQGKCVIFGKSREMLIHSEAYAQFNSMQTKDSTSVMKEYSNVLNWTDHENVLDVGCGPGDVTVNLILPLLSGTSQLTGLDISPQMIEYARNTYVDKGIKFITADFGTKHITEILPEQSFSKIFSFYCLHWIKDQQQVAINLASLLCSGGEVLAVIMANTTAFLVYQTLSEMEKWKPYMQDVNKYISPYFNVSDIQKMVHNVYTGAGLVVKAYEKRECSFTFPSLSCQLKSFEAVNPFFPRIPEELKAEFSEAIKQLVISYQHIQPDASDEVVDVSPTTYELIVLHLYKP